ncbi:MAG TPA: DUF6187 family protein [Pseudonocardiaceae bacterium]|jgi:hypothetical protein|nr:DUF6187 family protein [Pseudonocardiaceae bacterium]
MAEEEFDTRFAMPAVDHPALTEIGVILSGLDTDRLLAGLGASRDADDPALVTLLVDRLRHGDTAAMADVIAAGAGRWLTARAALSTVDPMPSVSASVRQAWQRALGTVLAADLGDGIGRAGHAYLAACWLRRTEVDAAARSASPTRTRTSA